ncbi:hypothetical protein [Rugosimonospora africana]|uniref:Uncharacterized protein n=1 Tax=Rugosimonospora africana TaxID=556532 RepID=A0A8J3QJG0_9ACTN|nr:hypothetical protein [Rugosimonospora africana]GIH12119.1 hypothetical protein Raf01_02910 [Rugosimonospora africana]
MPNLRVHPIEHAQQQPAPSEPVETDARTFADIENGEPDATLDEMVLLDAAIL